MMRVLSLGGLPKLDAVVFADTGGELPETYAYLDEVLAPELARAEIPLQIVTAGSLEAALRSTEPTSSNPTPPAHVLNADGTKGRIGGYRCSYDYKRRLIDRAVKALCGGRGAWKRSTVEQWIGFSMDELGRMKHANTCRCGHNLTTLGRSLSRQNVTRIHTEADGCSRCSCERFDPWQVNRWPLVELRMKRLDTIRWFPQHGYPDPPRSACYFCPNSSNERWQYLRDAHPDLFERACTLDETIRDGGGLQCTRERRLLREDVPSLLARTAEDSRSPNRPRAHPRRRARRALRSRRSRLRL